MRPLYTKHAIMRMFQRRITEEEVEAVLAGHYLSYHDRGGNDVLVGDVKGRRIKAVVAKDSDPPRIITVGD